MQHISLPSISLSRPPLTMPVNSTRRTTSSIGYHDQNSVYPSGYSSLGGSGGGGYYDDMSGDDDYSYGIDVYATSSNPNQLTITNLQSDGSQAASSYTPTVAAVASPTRRDNRQPLDWGQQQQLDGISSVQDLLNPNGNSNRQWPGQSNVWSQQSQFGNGAGYAFDLITGGGSDQSTSGSSDRASERHVLLNGSSARASGASSPTANGNNSRQLSAAHSSRPSVPTSTTTPAPEFVMINPTTTSN